MSFSHASPKGALSYASLYGTILNVPPNWRLFNAIWAGDLYNLAPQILIFCCTHGKYKNPCYEGVSYLSEGSIFYENFDSQSYGTVPS